jgi:hypothetical protein
LLTHNDVGVLSCGIWMRPAVGFDRIRAADFDRVYAAESLVVDAYGPGAPDVSIPFSRGSSVSHKDVGAIGAFVAQRVWKLPEAWFCSELIAAALIDCGYLRRPRRAICC